LVTYQNLTEILLKTHQNFNEICDFSSGSLPWAAGSLPWATRSLSWATETYHEQPEAYHEQPEAYHEQLKLTMSKENIKRWETSDRLMSSLIQFPMSSKKKMRLIVRDIRVMWGFFSRFFFRDIYYRSRAIRLLHTVFEARQLFVIDERRI